MCWMSCSFAIWANLKFTLGSSSFLLRSSSSSCRNILLNIFKMFRIDGNFLKDVHDVLDRWQLSQICSRCFGSNFSTCAIIFSKITSSFTTRVLRRTITVTIRNMWPAQSSSHRYCPASQRNSHLQLFGTCSSEPQSPKTEVELEFFLLQRFHCIRVIWSFPFSLQCDCFTVEACIDRLPDARVTILIMYEFQEWKTLPSSEDGSKAHLLNLYQFSNAWFQLGVNILQSATHLSKEYIIADTV